MAAFRDNDFCFACGTRNPLGLQLQFYRDGDNLCTRFAPQPHLQGWANVLHGGLQSTIFDDLMSNHLFRIERVWAVTAELSVRFRQPVPLDRELVFVSTLESRGGRIWRLSAHCATSADPAAPRLSTAAGRFVEVPREQ